MTKPTRRSPVARVLKSANTPYTPKVEQVEKGEPTICGTCKGAGAVFGGYGGTGECVICDGTGEVWE